PKSDDGAVVDDFDGRSERGGVAIWIEPAQHRSDRARRRCGAGTLGAVGEQLGVPLVESHDGLGQAVDGEALGTPAETLFVDLVQGDEPDLVVADVELSAGRSAGADPLAEQSERLTEGRQLLASVREVPSPGERSAPHVAQFLPAVRGASRMIDDLDP